MLFPLWANLISGEEILTLVPAILATVCALFEGYILNFKLLAERRFLKRLSAELESTKKYQFIVEQALKKTYVDPDTREAAIKLLEQVVKELSPEDQKAISEGFRQESEKGRSEYFRKIITSALTASRSNIRPTSAS